MLTAPRKHESSGVRLKFTPDETDLVCRMAALVRAGFRVDSAAEIARQMQHDADQEIIISPGLYLRVTSPYGRDGELPVSS